MLRALVARSRNSSGFTLTEIVAVVFIMSVITSIVAVAITSGTKLTVAMDKAVVQDGIASRALQGLASNIALASPIEAMGRNRLVLQVQRKNVCERHIYTVNTDTNSHPLSLQHTVQSLSIPAGAGCKDIALTRWSTVALSLDRVEVTGLTVGAPVFQYAFPGGTPLRIPGDNGYNEAIDRGTPCDVGIIKTTLTLDIGTDRPPLILRSITAPASAGWGKTC